MPGGVCLRPRWTAILTRACLAAERANDPEIVLQIMFTFFRLLHHEETAEVVIYDTCAWRHAVPCGAMACSWHAACSPLVCVPFPHSCCDKNV